MTAVIGLIVYTLPYVFVVIMITMARYKTNKPKQQGIWVHQPGEHFGK